MGVGCFEINGTRMHRGWGNFLVATRRLQRHPVFRLALEWYTQFEELDKDVSELVEEDLIVLGVAFDVFLKLFVLDQGHVRRQHHEGFGGDILVLLRAVPLYSIMSKLFLAKEQLSHVPSGTSTFPPTAAGNSRSTPRSD